MKYTNSKFFFEYLPHSFITNVTKEGNKKILNMTFEQLIEGQVTPDYSETNLSEVFYINNASNIT